VPLEPSAANFKEIQPAPTLPHLLQPATSLPVLIGHVAQGGPTASGYTARLFRSSQTLFISCRHEKVGNRLDLVC